MILFIQWLQGYVHSNTFLNGPFFVLCTLRLIQGKHIQDFRYQNLDVVMIFFYFYIYIFNLQRCTREAFVSLLKNKVLSSKGDSDKDLHNSDSILAETNTFLFIIHQSLHCFINCKGIFTNFGKKRYMKFLQRLKRVQFEGNPKISLFKTIFPISRTWNSHHWSHRRLKMASEFEF